MEIRDWAKSILLSTSIKDKLFAPESFTDNKPGSPLIIKEPCRPPGMSFRNRRKEEKLPPFHEHNDPDKRAVCLHRFAGHELLAVEIMAYTLLAFPEAPKSFRRGLAHTLKEEQEHVRLYCNHLQTMGLTFGDLPLYKHFWAHTPFIRSPLHFVCIMNLTFEMANLDFAPLYGKSFSRAGDQASSELLAKILHDEISHVRFGWQWLKKFKQKELSEWDAWTNTLTTTLLTPKRAKGFIVHESPRLKAGIPKTWIKNISAS